MKLFVVLIRTF